MKNIIYFGIGSKFSLDLLDKLILDNPTIETILTVNSSDKKILETRFPNKKFIVLNFYDINTGHYDESILKLIPIDQEVINVISPHFFNIFKIIDRLPERDFHNFEDRVNLFFKHLIFWNSAIQSLNIDHLIAMDMPHEVQDYVAYALCEYYKVKKCFFTQSQIPQFCQIVKSIEENDPRLHDFGNAKYSGEHIDNPLIRNYLEQQTNTNYVPFYMNSNNVPISRAQVAITKLKKGLTQLFNIIQISNIVDHLFYRQKFGAPAEKLIKAYLASVKVKADLTKNYIYIPLHFQPERTTSPQGGIFAFQELMIKMISNAIPAHVTIYVKEHPKQGKHGRNLDFYKNITALKNVCFIDDSYTTLELIKGCFAVATVTGTAGWEAFCTKKPVLLFGHIFYQFAPGVFKIQNNDDLFQAISMIENNNTNISTENRNKFLNCCGDFLIHGFSDEVYAPHAQISWEDNIIKISQAITTYFKDESKDE